MALPTRVSRALATADPFESFGRDINNVLHHFFGNGAMSTTLAPYAVDIREDADHLYVDAELPGFKKEEIDITLENQTLTISAERKEETKDQKKGDVLLNERRFSRFLRSFTLPPTISESAVDAKLNEGVLTITLNKREETKPRKIAVS